MSTLMLVNPRKRRAGGKRRSAAQVAATRKLVALNRARRSGTTHKRRRHNPVMALAANPRRRRRHVVHHAARRVSRHRRHNPISLRNPMGLLMPAVKGAAGAIAVNALVNYVPLPAMLKSGRTKYLTEVAFAVLLGTFGRRFLGHNAVQMAEGSLTVTATKAITDLLSGTGLKLGDSDGIAYYSPADIAAGGVYPTPGQQSLGAYQAFDGVGEYQGMGEYQYR